MPAGVPRAAGESGHFYSGETGHLYPAWPLFDSLRGCDRICHTGGSRFGCCFASVPQSVGCTLPRHRLWLGRRPGRPALGCPPLSVRGLLHAERRSRELPGRGRFRASRWKRGGPARRDWRARSAAIPTHSSWRCCARRRRCDGGWRRSPEGSSRHAPGSGWAMPARPTMPQSAPASPRAGSRSWPMWTRRWRGFRGSTRRSPAASSRGPRGGCCAG
jgi:hypothetical protein